MPNGHWGGESPEDWEHQRARRRRFWLLVIVPLLALWIALVVYARSGG